MPYELFRFRDGIYPTEFRNTPPVLFANKFNLGRLLGSRSRQDDRTAGLEHGVMFKRLLDSDLALQTLGLCNPSNGYIGG